MSTPTPLRPSQAARALAVAAVTLAVHNGVVTAFAVLYLPLVAEFGASRAEVAAVQSAVLLLDGFGAPLIGWAFDRLGPRRLIQCGALLSAGIKHKVGVHASRHAAGFLLLRACGGDLTKVQTFLRHTNVQTTSTWYQHVHLPDLRAGLERAGL